MIGKRAVGSFAETGLPLSAPSKSGKRSLPDRAGFVFYGCRCKEAGNIISILW